MDGGGLEFFLIAGLALVMSFLHEMFCEGPR